MHPHLLKFIQSYEANATLSNAQRRKLGDYEIMFLERVWGPLTDFDFTGLKPEFPFRDYQGKCRFIDFIYTRDGFRLAIEVDGLSTHANYLSKQEFDDHIIRQNDLILAGWIVLRFTVNQVEHHPTVCQRQIAQLMGLHWQRTNMGSVPGTLLAWKVRKDAIERLSYTLGGKVSTNDVVSAFDVNRKTAYRWLLRCVEEGLFKPIKTNTRNISYILK